MQPEPDKAVRADKWLWAARFYKTRALATQAISGGKVHLNGERFKPARRLKCGDVLNIRKGPYTFAIKVDALATQRRPATEARHLYSESEQSARERHELYRQRRLEGHSARRRERRPDQRTRRRIRQLKQQ